MPSCYKCSAPFMEEGLAADAVCAQCSSWLHCCANCVHYDEYSNSKCREPRAAFVFDRVGRNSCAFLKCKQVIREEPKRKLSPRAEQKDREGRAREGLERLFR